MHESVSWQGDDYKRTERQRTVIEAMITKVQKSGVTTINSVVDEVFDDISTNITPKQMLSLGSHALSYKMVDNSGFPFELKTKNMGKQRRLCHSVGFRDKRYRAA